MKALNVGVTLLSVLVLCACGGGSTKQDPVDTNTVPTELPTPALSSSIVVKQKALSKGQFEQALAIDEELQQLITKTRSAGYNQHVTAGVTEDDSGMVMKWAIMMNPVDENERIFAQMCDGSADCTSARIRFSQGSTQFLDIDGKGTARKTVGRPVLSKVLPGKDHDANTTLNAALTEEDEEVTVDLGSRHFVIANAYGDVFGLTMPIMQSVITESGAFTDVMGNHFATSGDIINRLQSGSPLDVLVWVGASVLEDMGGGDQKTVGMTVNRGAFGDETLTAKEVKDALGNSPFGGPGLVVLVGEQSWGDGSGYEGDNLSLFKELTVGGGRTVVGFQGRGDAVHLIDAANNFVAQYINGVSLGESLDAANTVLSKHGSAATMVSNHSDEPDKTLLGRLGEFWGSYEVPKAVRTTIYVNLNNKCTDDGGVNWYSESESQANFWVDVNFDGPFFTGQKVSTDVELDVTVQGVLMGSQPGDRVYLWIEGNLKKSVQLITIYGVGTILEMGDEEKPLRIFFDGEVTAGAYYNADGHTCHLISPKLSGVTSQPSWMDLPYKVP